MSIVWPSAPTAKPWPPDHLIIPSGCGISLFTSCFGRMTNPPHCLMFLPKAWNSSGRSDGRNWSLSTRSNPTSTPKTATTLNTIPNSVRYSIRPPRGKASLTRSWNGRRFNWRKASKKQHNQLNVPLNQSLKPRQVGCSEAEIPVYRGIEY